MRQNKTTLDATDFGSQYECTTLHLTSLLGHKDLGLDNGRYSWDHLPVPMLAWMSTYKVQTVRVGNQL
jgi:hypothetical protein